MQYNKINQLIALSNISWLKGKSILWFYKIINLFCYSLTKVFWPKSHESTPKKICIYRIGNIGDIICAVPAIIAIRRAYPQAHLTLLTSPGNRGMPGAKEMLENAWFLDRLWVYFSEDVSSFKGKNSILQQIKNESYDLFIILPSELWDLRTILRNMLFVKLCRVKSACGFMLSTIKIWGKEQSSLHQFDNEVERLIALLHYYHVPIESEIIYDLPILPSIEQAAQKIIDQHGLRQGQIIAFVPGAKRDINEWPLDYFVDLQKLLKKRYPESKVVILGGGDDVAKGEYIQRQAKDEAVINLAGKTSLMELAHLISKCQLVITNNTGTMHMASQAGVKVIGIFSSAELYGKWFPHGDQAKPIYKNIDCEACYYHCDRDKACIKNITPEDIIMHL